MTRTPLSWFKWPWTLSAGILLSSGLVLAQPATLPFTHCSSSSSDEANVTTVYAQILPNTSLVDRYLSIVVFGNAPQGILGFSNESTELATLFTTTTILTLDASTNSSYFCGPLRPPSPLPTLPVNDPNFYCPIPSGPFALGASVPLGPSRALSTLNTQLRAVDPFGVEVLCINVPVTPLHPGPLNSIYGNATFIFWGSIVLTIAYWLVIGIARVVSAWDRGISKPGSRYWVRMESAGFIVASAISGERLATSPALMRFGTPSSRDIIFHTQWCAALGMVAVQWPMFAYPLLSQAAWATLSYNISVTPSSLHEHWDPLAILPFNPPSNFADQIQDTTSPIFMDPTTTNTFFMLPSNATAGISSMAYTLGIRPENLFGICLALFLGIAAGVIIVSILIWAIEGLASRLVETFSAESQQSQNAKLAGTRSPGFSAPSKDLLDGIGGMGLPSSMDDAKSINSHNILRSASRFPVATRKFWWRRNGINSFHWNVLHGNLVRVLILFHLPVTIFSCYEMTLPRSDTSAGSAVLGAFSFIIFSLALPIFLVLRLKFTSTNKLYDETRTLLSLGPLYNHYRHGSQLFASLFFATNVAFGITIGCGQNSGTAQATIILVIEVVSALVTSIWLPWGAGAGMGLISFLICVGRIIIAVLLVILSPAISIGSGAGGWIAYGILVILALLYLNFTIMLLVKMVEGLTRIFGGIGFDRSKHLVDSGLMGACGLLPCCNSRHRRRTRRRAQQTAPGSDNQASPFAPPPNFNSLSGTTAKGSIHSGPPPSVLKPEHAMRPYREDSDDESGYIMGEWNGSKTYAPVVETPSAPAPSSGFSRVGGGRARFDTPYAIANSTLLPTTTPRLAVTPLLSSRAFRDDDDDDDAASSPETSRSIRLPAGAMPPYSSHARTKSQTAIIEHAASPSESKPSTSRPGSADRQASSSRRPASPGFSQPLYPPVTITPPDDDDTPPSTPRKKSWFNIRKSRPMSEGARPVESEPPILSALEPDSAASGKSFVVIRDKRPQGSHLSPTPPDSAPTERASFSVIRRENATTS